MSLCLLLFLRARSVTLWGQMQRRPWLLPSPSATASKRAVHCLLWRLCAPLLATNRNVFAAHLCFHLVVASNVQSVRDYFIVHVSG